MGSPSRSQVWNSVSSWAHLKKCQVVLVKPGLADLQGSLPTYIFLWFWDRIVASPGPLQHRLLLFLLNVNRSIVWIPKGPDRQALAVTGAFTGLSSRSLSLTEDLELAAAGKVWTGAAEDAQIASSYKLLVMGRSCFRPRQPNAQIMGDRALALHSQARKVKPKWLGLDLSVEKGCCSPPHCLNAKQSTARPKRLHSLPPLNTSLELALIFIAFLSTAAVRKFKC